MSSKLILPAEGLAASWAHFQTCLLVDDHVCKDAELHETPGSRALDRFLADTVDKPDVTSEIASSSKL